MHMPNKLTAETLEKSERGEDVHHADSAESMFKDLGVYENNSADGAYRIDPSATSAANL